MSEPIKHTIETATPAQGQPTQGPTPVIQQPPTTGPQINTPKQR